MQAMKSLANDTLTRDFVYPFGNANFLAKNPPLCIEGGEDVYVTDRRGKRYFDGQGGL
jgi:adenosylmethionine-8-amino-7-oxononanoate aminotransferase